MGKFDHIKVGDTVTRMLAGVLPMRLKVGKVENGVIFTYNHAVPLNEGWKFNAENGAEIDEDLGWDGITKTGSHLVE